MITIQSKSHSFDSRLSLGRTFPHLERLQDLVFFGSLLLIVVLFSVVFYSV